MKTRTRKRSRDALPRFMWPAVTEALSDVRLARARMLAGDVGNEIRAAIARMDGPPKRVLKRMVAADLQTLRDLGDWSSLARIRGFLSPYAQRDVVARLRRATIRHAARR